MWFFTKWHADQKKKYDLQLQMDAEDSKRKEEIRRASGRSLAEDSAYHGMETSSQLKCPKCFSTQLSADSKGFSLGKAAVGGVLLGGVGLLGGVIGSKTTMITCMKCGKKWQAGKN